MDFDFTKYLKDLSTLGINATGAVSNCKDITRKYLSNDDAYLIEYAKKEQHTGWLTCTDEGKKLTLMYFEEGRHHANGLYQCDPANNASRFSFSLSATEEGTSIEGVSALFRDDYDEVSVNHEKPASQPEHEKFGPTISLLKIAYLDGAIDNISKERVYDHGLSPCQRQGVNRTEYELKKGKPTVVDGVFNDAHDGRVTGKDFVDLLNGGLFKDVPSSSCFSADDKKMLAEKLKLFQQVRPEANNVPLLEILDGAIYENPEFHSLTNQHWERANGITGWVAEKSSRIHGSDPEKVIEFKYLENGFIAQPPNCPYNKVRVRYALEGDYPETEDDCDPVFSGFEFLNTLDPSAQIQSILLKETNRTVEFEINSNNALDSHRDSGLISSYGGAKFSGKPCPSKKPASSWFGIYINPQNPEDNGLCFENEAQYNEYLAEYGSAKKPKLK